MSVTEMIGLFTAALSAGAINAVAGGGTLVLFPTLLYFGTPPLVANATSTLGLLVGTSGSVFGFRKHLVTIRPWLLRLMPVSLVGGVVGSALLTWTSERVFSKLIPFLILFATLLFLLQAPIAAWIRRGQRDNGSSDSHSFTLCMIAQFFLSVYGGYFGAGIGILMLASFAFLGLRNIHEMNTLKTVLGSLLNLVAALWFVGEGLIHWPKAIAIMLGGVVGYYLGSHYSQKIPQIWVRRIVTGVGLGLSVLTFYREFFR